jgi:site-specific DNA-methyltransferase (adenine-specific)
MDNAPVPSFEIAATDALAFLQGLPDESVDAIVTDPPYCSGASREAGRGRAKEQGSIGVRRGSVTWFQGDNMTTPGLVWLLRSVAFEAARVLQDGHSLVVFCDWRMWANLAPALESAGLKLQNMIVWDKGSAALGTGFRCQHELAIHLCKGTTGRFYSVRGTNLIGAKRVTHTKREHATQKPVDLLREILRVVAPVDGFVVDPFMGSGSTGVAALREGMNFLGCDRAPSYVETARRRLERVSQGLEDLPPTAEELEALAAAEEPAA